MTLVGLSGLAALLFSSCSSTETVRVMDKERAKQIAAFSAAKSDNGYDPAPADPAVLAQAADLPKDKHGMPTYPDDVTHRYVRATAYSHMQNEPGAPGRMNAAGGILKYGNVRSVAADWSRYPLGTTFKIKGLPHLYVVDDYGSALTNTNTIDMFHPTLAGIKRWGVRNLEIDIVKMGSYERSLALLKGRQGYWHCKDMYDNAIAKVKAAGPAVASVQDESAEPQEG
ncbi:MAG: 3D domain-containing protein [Verrucomicrobiota bacterium JB023]|nr:3D domain-containing protein [Verrucomicrobiota bacterium JB023]